MDLGRLFFWYTIKNYIKNLFSFNFLNIKNISSLSYDEYLKLNLQSNFIKYLFYKFFSYIINLLEIIQNKFDIQAEKIQFTRIFPNGQKTIILDKNKYGKSHISFSDLNNYLTLTKFEQYDDTMINIIINFELISDTQNIDLKKFLIPYKDQNRLIDNTLENILLFNQIPIPESGKIKIKTFQNGQPVINFYNLQTVLDKHINFFIDSAIPSPV